MAKDRKPATKDTGRKFPWYLKLPDPVALRWVASRLKQARQNRTPQDVANKCQLPLDRVRALERGEFHLPVGELRFILERGYNLQLLAVLEEYFKQLKTPDEQANRPFQRDWYYRVRLPWVPGGEMQEEKTPMFVAGDPQRYLWAVPLRRLEESSVVTEFLELAPARRLKPSGETPAGAHEGEEIIMVIHGRVIVSIQQAGNSFAPELGPGEVIHFSAKNRHLVRTLGNTSALLAVVRPLAE